MYIVLNIIEHIAVLIAGIVIATVIIRFIERKK